MERREQVFVSSTYTDLHDERQAVIQTLLQADCFPAGMELFPASDDEKWDLIQRVIDDSDYYIVLIGGRYGSVDSDGLSFTEKEFDYAESVGKPIMGFVHSAPEQIPVGKSELDADARAALAAFKEKVERRAVKYWGSPAELAGAVALALIQIRKTHPAWGWVRASMALTPEVERELVELRGEVARLQLAAESRDSAARRAGFERKLARGDEPYTMDVRVRYWTAEAVAAGRTYDSTRRSFWVKRTTTWDELLIEVGPLMMIEASETELDSKLDWLATILVERPIPEAPEGFGKVARIECSRDAVHDVTVQLYGLGLIESSSRRHPVNDSKKYWTLTPQGRETVLALRGQPSTESESEPRAGLPLVDAGLDAE